MNSMNRLFVLKANLSAAFIFMKNPYLIEIY